MNRIGFFFAGFLLASQLVPAAQAQLALDTAKPAAAKKVPKEMSIHGDKRVDDYFWLREKTSPEVISYLNAENAYTKAIMAPTEPFQAALYKEMLGRIKQTDLSVPYRLGEFWYYSRTEEGKQYPIHCRKKGSLEGKEQVTLDINELGKGKKFTSLGAYQISDDGNLLAYSMDHSGFREYTLYIKNLATGESLTDRIAKISGSPTWAANNKTFFYVIEDAAKRPYRLFRHILGKEKDDLVYEEKDELYRLGAHRSRDKEYLFADSRSSTTSEARYMHSDRPQDALQVILPREEKHEYDVEHRDGLFYIRTNKDAKNYRLVTAPVENPAPANWKEMIAHRPDVLLERIDLFTRHGVVKERATGLEHLKIYDLKTGKIEPVKFPEPIYSVMPDANREYDTNVYRFHYQSLVTPDSVFDYDMDSHTSKLLKQTEVLGGYVPTEYQSERIYATASDGTKIPISLVYKKGVKKDGTNPLLLYGYGSYGFSLPISFSPTRLSLLDRGAIYAMAHIRGGKEMGETWHDQGKMMNKRNTFTDFIAAADYLMAEKYTCKERMAIEGGSAGGLLIGAVINLRPDLCKCAVLQVPFVDVINTMLDASLPLTVQEYLEWGNPNKKDEYEYMKSYCPYTNLAAKDYPATMVRTSLNDSQVMYWEPAKYTAKMRATRTDKNVLIFRCNMDAGHGGASGRYDALKEQAFTYAFILNQLGITH